MDDSPSNPPEGPPPKRFQFGFWTLAEVVAGVAVAAALVAELRDVGWLVLTLAAGVLCSALYIGAAVNRERAIGRVGIAWLLALVVCCLSPVHFDGRKVARRSVCNNNMKQIVLALKGYHEVWGQYPPPVVRGPDGAAMHSWRTLILPYLEYASLYEKYDFTQPWNSPANNAITLPSYVLGCPAWRRPVKNLTNYFYVVGPGREAVESGLTQGELEAADGAANTILIVESNTLAVDWFEPRDLTMNEALAGINTTSAPCISSDHGLESAHRQLHGANIATADGQVHYATNSVDDKTLLALLTIDGGEKIDWSKLDVIPDHSFVFRWLVLCTVAYVSFIIWRHWPRRRSAFLS